MSPLKMMSALILLKGLLKLKTSPPFLVISNHLMVLSSVLLLSKTEVGGFALGQAKPSPRHLNGFGDMLTVEGQDIQSSACPP